MKASIDTKLIQKLVYEEDAAKRQAFLDDCRQALLFKGESSVQLVLGWPSLLDYLDFRSLFDSFQKFDAQNKLFSTVVEVLKLEAEKEVIIYLYDQLFVECLTQIKTLPIIDPQVLLNKIDMKRRRSLFYQTTDPFSFALQTYEKRLVENPRETLHDLILYLAWDRMCVYLATIFDHPTLQIGNGLVILRACLIESFQHITRQGQTAPSFFRLLEALYAFQMKEENLQSYSDLEWEILCRSSIALQPREALADACYLDTASGQGANSDGSSVTVLTLEKAEKVRAFLSLADDMSGKLTGEIADWSFTFSPYEIVCFRESEKGLVVDALIRH